MSQQAIEESIENPFPSKPNPNQPLRFPVGDVEALMFDRLVSTLGGGSRAWTVRRVLRIQSAVLATHVIDSTQPKSYQREDLPAAKDFARTRGELIEVQLELPWKKMLKQQQRALGVSTWAETIRTAVATTSALIELQAAGQAPRLNLSALKLLERTKKP